MRTIIPNTNVLDVVNCRTLVAHDVVIDDGLITELRDTRPFANHDRILRGGPNRWVIPGLIDAHVHLLEIHDGPNAGPALP